LLSHTSGIPSDNQAFTDLIGKSFAQESLNLDGLRYWLVRQWSTQPLAAEPGTSFAYANMGYVLAGAMLERVARSTWEEMVVARIFTPFGFRTAGFGPQSSLGRVDAPLGHLIRPDGTLMPMLAGPDGDNPVILGPAGTVHLSILEFAAWAGWNAGEGRRAPALVRPKTVRLLHTEVIAMPPLPGAAPGTPSGGGGYALGWGIARLPYSTEPFVTHAGSNGMNLATVAMQPTHDFAMVIATNVGGTKADAALRALTQVLYERFGPAR
jgi:CubicO group peptidase (beta-lactamase class C family)